MRRKSFTLTSIMMLGSSVSNAIDTKLTKMIDKGLDPTDSLKPGLKRLLIRDIAQELDNTIVKDKAHLDRVNRLWKAEERAGFNGASKDSIVMAYLSRAKALIPKIRAAKRKEYFDDQVDDDNDTRDKLRNVRELYLLDQSLILDQEIKDITNNLMSVNVTWTF